MVRLFTRAKATSRKTVHGVNEIYDTGGRVERRLSPVSTRIVFL